MIFKCVVNRCVDMFYVPYFSLHHQYKLSEFLGFCKTPKNVGYIFSASGGSLNTCRLLHKMVKRLLESVNTTWPHAGKGTCPKDKLVVFFRALLLFPLFYAEKGDVWTQAL